MSATWTPTRVADPDGATTHTRRAVLVQLAAGLALSAAVAVRAHDTTSGALRELGVADAGSAAIVVGLLAVVFGAVVVVCALTFGVVLLHLAARLAGSPADLRTSAVTYLGCAWPLAVRNLVLALVLLLPVGLDPARLGVLAFGDPFLLFTGWLLFRALPHSHRLSTTRAAVVALVAAVGGVLVGLVAMVTS